MIINMTGGGVLTGAIKKATIAVSYPTGSVCKVKSIFNEYEAKDKEGSAGFAVNAGKWTVSATDSTDPAKTRSSEITVVDGKAYYVPLTFTTYLYNEGDLCESITGGWIKHNATNSASVNVTNGTTELTIAISNYNSGAGTGRAGPANPIDLTDISKIKVSVNAASSDYGLSHMEFGVATSLTGAYVKTQKLTVGEAEYELDVSGLSGQHYVSIQGTARAAFSGVEGAWPAHSTRFEISSMSFE